MNLLQKTRSVFRQSPANPAGNPVVTSGVMPWDAAGRIQPGDYAEMVKAYYSWVFACASCNARNVAEQGLHLYKRTSPVKEEWEEIFEHPFLELMDRVNPTSNQFELLELTSTYQDITGNAYWYLPKNGLNLPAEIWQLQAQYVKIVPSKERFIGSFLYQLPGMNTPVKFEPEEIIHFKMPNPNNPYYGAGCVEAARYSIDSNEYQKRFERGTFKNGTTPGTVLTSEQPINDTIAKRILDNWKQFHSGVDKTGEPAILGSGLKIDRISLTPQELSFLEGQASTRKEICAMFGTPEAMLGYVTDANRANMDALIYIYMKQTIRPRLKRLELKLNEQLVSRYDPKLYAEFDNPVPEDKEYKLREREVNLRVGFWSPNEARQQEGLDPVEGGDTPLVPFTLAPLGTSRASAPPAPASAPEKKPEDEPKDQAKGLKKEYSERELRKLAVWRTGQERAERRFNDIMVGYFSTQERMVERNLDKLKGLKIKTAKAISEDDIEFIIFPEKAEDHRLVEATYVGYELSMKTGIEIANAEIGYDFSVTNPKVDTWVRDRGAELIKINDTTAEAIRENIRDVIRQGLNEREAAREIAKRIGKVFDEAKGPRSIMIARTETTTAANAAEEMVYLEAGIENKEWLTAEDELVCEECASVNGEIVPVGTPFSIDGPAAHPNCRCTILSVDVPIGE